MPHHLARASTEPVASIAARARVDRQPLTGHSLRRPPAPLHHPSRARCSLSRRRRRPRCRCCSRPSQMSVSHPNLGHRHVLLSRSGAILLAPASACHLLHGSVSVHGLRYSCTASRSLSGESAPGATTNRSLPSPSPASRSASRPIRTRYAAAVSAYPSSTATSSRIASTIARLSASLIALSPARCSDAARTSAGTTMPTVSAARRTSPHSSGEAGPLPGSAPPSSSSASSSSSDETKGGGCCCGACGACPNGGRMPCGGGV
mmetsp:Transcript_44807/g.148514  ORF Transcript_44807/g.148514 Transcript_44807/m.148514 type:complete len:262 (-) Transcript_44807:456-1241(-)